MIPGLKIILMGIPGSGKTHAIRTLIDADMEVFCILTEPNAINTLTNMRGATDKYKASLTNGMLHWKFIAPALAGWESMKKAANLIATFDLGTLQGMPAGDKRDYMQFIEVLNQCANYKCELTGKEYGPIDNFDPQTQVVVIDSLSGLNRMFLSMICGSKPVKTLPEWGTAIDAEVNFVNHLTFGILAHVVIMAHVTRTVDEVQGGIKTMVNALGKSAPQEMPKNFTDCILAQEIAGEFSWSTATLNTETKATTLLLGEKFKPDFGPLISTWRERLALTEAGEQTNERTEPSATNVTV